MNQFYFCLFNSIGLLQMVDVKLKYHSVICDSSVKTKRNKNPKNVSIEVDIPECETKERYKKALDLCYREFTMKKRNIYTIYLKQLFGSRYANINIENIMEKLERLKDRVDFNISQSSPLDIAFIKNLLDKNEYFSKNTSRYGVTVKLFESYYNNRKVMVKTYVYDPEYPSVKYSVEKNFKNEALFQLYAYQIHSNLDFISPELYYWGQVPTYCFANDRYKYKCLFLIMEYIPHITLKSAIYSTENMKRIYDRVDAINLSMMQSMLHHNDLHGGNIMVKENDTSPRPAIYILDFGEASLGPRRPLYTK